MTGLKTTGTKVLAKQLTALERKIFGAAKVAVSQEAEMLMTESKSLVPVDKGILRTSGGVSKPKKIRGGAGVEITIGYGGAASSYALTVHEDMNANHTVGQAKFLSAPFKRRKPTMSKRLAATIKQVLGL